MLADKSDYRIHLEGTSLTDEQRSLATRYWGRALQGESFGDGTEDHFNAIIAVADGESETEISAEVTSYLAGLLA